MSGHKPWSKIQRKYRLTPGPWMTLRPGSSFEVPSFRPSGSVAHIPLATGKSKKLYERALAMAFRQARLYLIHDGVRRKPGVGVAAFRRLLERCDEN